MHTNVCSTCLPDAEARGTTIETIAARNAGLRMLLAIAFLEALAIHGGRPSISYRALTLGASTAEIGLIASAYGVIAFVGAIPIGHLADRLGGRPLVAVGSVAVAVTLVLISFSDAVWMLALGQASLGISQLMVVIGLQTALTTLGDPMDRGRLIGIYSVATTLGHALGPAGGGLLVGSSGAGAGTVFLVGAAVALVGTALTTRFPSDDREPRGTGNDARSTPLGIMRRPGMRQALIGSIVILSAMDILVAYLPVYGEDRGISPQVIGLAIGMMYFGQMPSRLVLDRLITRFGSGRVLLASMAIPAVLIPALLLPINGTVLVVTMGLIGLNLGVGQPITLLLVSLASAARDRGLAMSLRLVGNRLGQVTVPAAVGATAGQAGVAGIIVAVALLLGAGSLAAALGRSSTDPPPG